MEDILSKKTYKNVSGTRITFAGIGFFNPYFVAESERVQEKIESSKPFLRGRIEIVSIMKDAPLAPIPEQTVKPVIFEAETKLSRRALFAQHDAKITNASFLVIQKVALDVGMTENEIAGYSRAKLMKAIRDRTVS